MALTEQQLEMLGDELVPIYQQLEHRVIADIARRVAKTGRLTETAEIMVETLRDKGYSPNAIQHQVMRVLGANKGFQREIESNTLAYKKALQADIEATRVLLSESGPDLWEEAGNMAFHADLSVWQSDRKPVKDGAFSALVSAMQTRMADELKSLTKSMGFRLPTGDYVKAADAYTRMLNLALVKTTSGAYSYQQALEECVRDLARSGLRTIDFASGRSYQLDTAVRNAVMTASSQLAGEITMHNMEQIGAGYVEVSAHWGARTGEGHANHAGWQGKVYKVEGSDGVYGNLEQETGYPSDPAGLHGYNCRHTFYPFWPGISEPNEWPPEPEPKEWNGRTYDYYTATQEQRRREREIRALRREQNACKEAGLNSKAKQLGGLISTRAAEYEEFSDAMEISAKKNRLRVENSLKNSSVHGNMRKGRELANSMRSTPRKLTNDEISFVKEEARSIGIDESILVFNVAKQTAYDDNTDTVHIVGDVFPDFNGISARDRMSVRAVLAHEYYGHRAFRGTKLPAGSYEDEIRASVAAALNAPRLSDEDRQMLVRDALDRANERGIRINITDRIRSVLYGI